MFNASAENLSTTIRKPLFRIAWHFWTNTKYSGEVSLIISVDIHRECFGVSELEYFLSVENIEISLYAQARQSLLLLTQGNIYNRLTFLNKYLMFSEELNELFRENWSKFLTAGYLVFWKQFPAAGYLDTSLLYCEKVNTGNDTPNPLYIIGLLQFSMILVYVRS